MASRSTKGPSFSLMWGIQDRQFEVGRLSATVADYEDQDLFSIDSPFSGDTAPVTWGRRQVPLALERFQEEGLVCLDDARLVLARWLSCHRCRKR